MKRGLRGRSLPALLLVWVMSAMLAACGAGGANAGSVPAAPMPAQDAAVPAVGGALPEQGEDGTDGGARMVIRSKVLRLEVASTPDAITKVRDLTTTHSGTVEAMQVATDSDEWIYRNDENGYGDGTALRGWITVRVPSASYEKFVTDVSAVGTIKFQSEATEDVTQQHVDLSARLDNLRAQEKRLRDFFDAAKDVKEMLSVEQELGRVRGDIESLDAQVKFLERQAAMATVTIELSEPRPVISSGSQSWGFVQAITDGVRGAASLLTALITVLIATSPLWIAAIVLFFPIRGLIRRRRAAKGAPAWIVRKPSADPDAQTANASDDDSAD